MEFGCAGSESRRREGANTREPLDIERSSHMRRLENREAIAGGTPAN